MPRHPYNPELADAILKARTILRDTGDFKKAAAGLLDLMSPKSTQRCLSYATFRYVAMIPDGHPLKAELRAKDAAKQRRLYRTGKHRQAVIERDNGQCQRCRKKVSGRNATLDHIDPEGPDELENLRLYCRSCNASKSRLSDAQVEGREQVRQRRQLEMEREREFNDCPCIYHGCPPDCAGCYVCREHNAVEDLNHPARIICGVVTGIRAEFGFDWSPCPTEYECRQAIRCQQRDAQSAR